jgi:hypothetical protein
VRDFPSDMAAGYHSEVGGDNEIQST